MAICVSVAFVPVTPTPPPRASALFEAAASWASRLMVSAGTPDAVAAAARSTPPTAPRSIASSDAPPAAPPSSTMTLRIASASTPSVPGALRTHSSALPAVMDIRGSMCTAVPARPLTKPCIWAKPTELPSAPSHVSRKSAPKDKQIARLADGVVRNGVASEHGAIGCPQGLVPDRLVRHPRPRAEDADPLVHETPEGSRLEPAHQRDLPPLAGLHKGADLVGHLLLGLVPGEGLARGERPAIAIGMVQALESRLPCDAERPTRPREARIALELDDAAIAVLREHAASGRAFATGGREVRRDPGNDLFGRRHQREQLTCRDGYNRWPPRRRQRWR